MTQIQKEDQTVELLTEYLLNHKMTISTAESATSGYLGKILTDRAGSSSWYWGGMQTYSIEAKQSMLGVDPQTIRTYGTVSLECAKEMAMRINAISHTSLSVSITGVAGPGSDEKGNSVGKVCFGFSCKEKTESVCMNLGNLPRDVLRKQFALYAVSLALAFLQDKDLNQTAKSLCNS